MSNLSSKIRFLVLGASVGLVALPLSQASSPWMPPKHGYVIEVTTPQGIPQQVGQPAQIIGTIRFVGETYGKPDKFGKCHGGKTTATSKGPNKWKCPPLPSLVDQLKEDGIELISTFPDSTQPVQLTLTGKPDSIAFSYTTPALKAQDLNALSIQVIHGLPEMSGLMKAQAKLDLRIKALNALITKLTTQNAKPKEIEKVKKLRDQLQTISVRIARKIEDRKEMVAEALFPLQVGNQVAGPSRNLSIQGHFRTVINSQLGSAIEGEKTRLTAQITHLPESTVEDDDDDDDGQGNRWWFQDLDRYVARFYWNGKLVSQQGPQPLARGKSIRYEFETEKLKPEDSNVLTAQLYASAWWGMGTKFSELSYDLPVADDSTAPQWLVAQAKPEAARTCLFDMQPIQITAQDPFGLVDSGAIRAGLVGTLTSGQAVTADLTNKLTLVSPDQGQTLLVTDGGASNPVQQGKYVYSIRGVDLAGNAITPNPYTTTFRVNRTPPLLTLLAPDSIFTNKPYTNKPQVSFSANVVDYFDLCQIQTTATDNGAVIGTSNTADLPVTVTLVDGVHQIEVQAKNASDGLISNKEGFQVIVDTVTPVLSGLVPADGAVINTLSFPVTGKSSEPLLSAKLNGTALTLSADGKAFSGTFTAPTEGLYTLHLITQDLATNTTAKDIPIQVLLRALNGDLLSVVPDPVSSRLIIRGAPGATRPGLTVVAEANFFNRESATGAQDGSFSISLRPFQKATVSATDPSLARTDTATVTFGNTSSTTLSGIVRDVEEKPIANVLVSIGGTQLSARTDESGVFKFTSPVTGDQTLWVDGAQAVQPPAPAAERHYGRTAVSVTVGIGYSNVLERPIYLAHIPQDGSATEITAATGGIVTSPHAPGVTLSIPAGSARFPDGAAAAAVGLMTIDSKVSTVEVPQFASSKKVITLEPSGMTFSKPVEVTLPNDSHLPVGLDVALISMDSRRGSWTVDGVATVIDQNTIRTKPGAGISHFSSIFVSPVGPKVSQMGAKDRPGADMFNGAVTADIALPSFQVLGSETSASLAYRSSWAVPTVMMTNLFSLPRETLEYERVTSLTEGAISRVETKAKVRVTNQPKEIRAQFETTNVKTNIFSFNASQLPEKAAVSFAVELKDPSTQEYLQSNVYPYSAHYEIDYEGITVATFKSDLEALWVSKTKSFDPQQETNFKTLFPPDLSGSLFVQNHSRSPAGSGWKLTAAQRILNTTNDSIVIEEGDGSLSSYAVNNTIQTVFNANGKGIDLNQGVDNLNYQGANSANWPSFSAVNTSHQLVTASLVSDTVGPVLGNLHATSGSVAGWRYTNNEWDGWDDDEGSICQEEIANFMVSSLPRQLARLSSGSLFGTDGNFHSVFRLAGGATDPFIRSSFATPPTFSFNYIGSPFCESNPVSCPLKDGFYREERQQIRAYCGSIPGMSCNFVHFKDQPQQDYNSCGSPPLSSGAAPVAGGFNGDGALSMLRSMNDPRGITPGPRPNTLVVADFGNHRVRLIDLDQGSIQTIAGNGGHGFGGDGGPATSAEVRHPKGVVYDADGSLYISTENGEVRVVDTAGNISTLVGGPGATLGDNRPANQVRLNNPFGMVVDSSGGKKILYIAETGGNSVRKVDLMASVKTVTTVAGLNFTASYNGDNGPALNSYLNAPTLLGLDASGNVLVVDAGNQRIRRIVFQNASGGTLAFAPLNQDNSTLTRDGAGNWTRRYRNGTVATFDSQGRQTSLIDRLGQRTEFVYDPSTGLLSAVVYPGNISTTYQYSAGKLTSITDPFNRVTRFTYDFGGHLDSVLFPDGVQKRFSYNSKGLLSAIRNERSVLTQFQYNDWNRIQSVTRAVGTPDAVTTTYSDMASATAANNYTDGQKGELLSADTSELNRIQTGAQSISMTLSSSGYIQDMKGADNKVTRIDTNFRGQPVRIRRNFRSFDNEDPADDAWDSEITYVYDERPGRVGDVLLQTDTATSVTVSKEYNLLGDVTRTTNARGKVSTRDYDPTTGLLIRETSPNDLKVEYEYYPGTMLTKRITQKAGSTVISQSSYTHDSIGNLKSETDPAGTVTTYDRDAFTNVNKVTVSNPAGTLSEIRQYDHDSMNRLIAAKTPKNELTTYSYSETGRLKVVTDPQNQTIEYEFDSLDRVIKKTDQLKFSTTYQYDSDGNLAAEIDPNGNTKSFRYDAVGRRTKRILPDNVYETTYDDLGRVAQVSDSKSKVSMSYDTLNRLKTTRTTGLGGLSSYPSIELAYNYDLNGNPISIQDSLGGNVAFDYDDLDRLKKITKSSAEIYEIDYQDALRQAGFSRPGIQSTFAMDTRGLLSSVIHRASGTGNTLAQFAYQYDYLGNRTRVDAANASLVYGYDANRQLASLSNPEASGPYQAETFTYDAIGNRLTDSQGVFQYDARAQRLQEDYTYFYYFDNNGNLVKKQAKANFPLSAVTNYFYSSENQLLGFKVYPSGGTQLSKEVSYVYDAAGRRIKKVVVDHAATADPLRTFTRQYVYQGQEILAEFDGDGKLLARYTHSGLMTDDVLTANITNEGAQAGLARAAGTYQYLKDAQGTVTDVADLSGNKVQHYVYSAFGVLLGIQDAQAADVSSSPIVNTSFGFTGRELDQESGLMYYRARYYDTHTGRFLQKDPHPGYLSLPISAINSYTYAFNTPAVLADPSGREPITVGTTIFLSSVVASVLIASLAVSFTATVIYQESTAALNSMLDSMQANLTAKTNLNPLDFDTANAINHAVSLGRDLNSSPAELANHFREINKPGLEHLANAEHYLYAKELVQNKHAPAAYVQMLVIGYQLRKLLVYRSATETPASWSQLSWGLGGAVAGANGK